jgi:putative ATP-dependent endonuclease of the OLD family
VLDRVGEVAPDTRGVLIVEGGTDEAYLRLAADRLGRADELDDLVIRPAGGAMAGGARRGAAAGRDGRAAAVLLDADEAGRRARTTLVSRFGFDRTHEVLTYADVFEGGPSGVEAETLFDIGLVRRFVRERGRSASHGERRLHTLDHVDLTSSGKSAFVGWLDAHADPEHLARWGDLLDLLGERFTARGSRGAG